MEWPLGIEWASGFALAFAVCTAMTARKTHALGYCGNCAQSPLSVGQWGPARGGLGHLQRARDEVFLLVLMHVMETCSRSCGRNPTDVTDSATGKA